jgi:hypothetical protein
MINKIIKKIPDQEIIDLYQQIKNIKQTAKILNKGKERVAKAVRDTRNSLKQINEKEVVKKYKEFKKINKVGVFFKISENKVERILMHHDVEIYSNSPLRISETIQSQIKLLYSRGGKTLRDIATETNTFVATVERVLYREKLISSKELKARTKKINFTELEKNFLFSRRWLVSLGRLSSKFQFLYYCVSRNSSKKTIFDHEKKCYKKINEYIFPKTKEFYFKFIEYFYSDKQFNFVYDNWVKNNKIRLARPSLDHKVPLSRGGSNDFTNLHFIPFLENRAKNNYTWDEWMKTKKNINLYLLPESFEKNE